MVPEKYIYERGGIDMNIIKFLLILLLFIVGIYLTIMTIRAIKTNRSKEAAIKPAIFALLAYSVSLYSLIPGQEKIDPYIVLNANALELRSTDEYDLVASTSPQDSDIKWSSSNSDIITVDNNGHLKAIDEGIATIVAKMLYKGIEYTDICNIKITDPAVVLASSYMIHVNETVDLPIETTPVNAGITWKTSNPDIVDIDDNGKIEGISEGTATITATILYNDTDYSADCVVTVGTLTREDEKAVNDNPETNDGNGLSGMEPDSIPLTDDDVVWLQNENVYIEASQKTVREDWSDCIRFGSSNLNADSDAYIIVACDRKYSRFTAEIAPQEGFDESDGVVLIVYGVRDDVQISKEEYSVDFMTKNTEIELDIAGVDELYIYKDGDYSQAKRGGQYINGYTGMGVLMRNAVLHK